MSLGSRRCARPLGRRRRRGATLVLVVLCMTALLGLSALAIDFARLYTGLNEMQTAADAAALHGAMLIQKSPTTGVANETSIKTFATTYNAALGGPVDRVIVTPYHYEEADVTKQKSLASWGNDSLNAVQVSVTRTSGLLMLGRLLKVVMPSPTRTATAWVANFTGSSCVRSWGIEVGRLINRANPAIPASTERAISFAEIAALRASDPVKFVLAPPGTTPTNGQINASYGGTALYGGNWAALDPGSSGGSFTSGMVTCNTSTPIRENDIVSTANSVNSFPAVGNSLDRGAAPVCSALVGSLCMQGLKVGGSVVMMFGYNNGTGAFADPSQNHVVARVGSFVLVCFKRAQNGSNAACSEADNYGVNWNAVAIGTILGYLDFTTPTFTGAFSLGTGAGSGGSTQQRLILVDPTNP